MVVRLTFTSLFSNDSKGHFSFWSNHWNWNCKVGDLDEFYFVFFHRKLTTSTISRITPGELGRMQGKYYLTIISHFLS